MMESVIHYNIQYGWYECVIIANATGPGDNYKQAFSFSCVSLHDPLAPVSCDSQDKLRRFGKLQQAFSQWSSSDKYASMPL